MAVCVINLYSKIFTISYNSLNPFTEVTNSMKRVVHLIVVNNVYHIAPQVFSITIAVLHDKIHESWCTSLELDKKVIEIIMTK